MERATESTAARGRGRGGTGRTGDTARTEDAARAQLVAAMVALATGAPVAEILHGAGATRAVRARQLCIYLCYVVWRWPLARAGAAFGRDRTTAGLACRTVEDRRDDPRVDDALQALEACLTAAPFEDRVLA